MSVQTGPEADPFAADFGDGAAMAREWIAGRGDLPELMLIIKDMPRDLGGLEAGFLSAIDAAVRGDRRSEIGAPDPAKAQLALAPSAEPKIDIEEFHRRRRERELAARVDELARRNAEAFVGLQHAFAPGNQMQNGADRRGW